MVPVRGAGTTHKKGLMDCLATLAPPLALLRRAGA